MTASDPMDVDPTGNGEEVGTSDPSPLPKDLHLPETDESHNTTTRAKSKTLSPSKEPLANDKGCKPSQFTKHASVPSEPSSPETIQDEIVVGQRHKPSPQPEGKPVNEKPDTQAEPATPSNPQRTKKIIIKKAAATPTPTMQARFELKGEEPASPTSRRNPKRTASAMAQRQPTNESSHEEILDATLMPVEGKELEDWAGWAELESEPAFFNFILRDIGAEDVLIKEVLSLEEESIRMIPKPLHGLIFLFQYQPEDWDVEENSDTDDVWFANQTVENACGTIAMMNILMNAPSIRLGEALREFKEETKAMSSPLRGHAISTNKSIRKVHNSFTRRLDHLNADLCLSHKAERAAKRKKPVRGRRLKGRTSEETGYHFIAYVPVNGYVWELDGMKSRPTKLEPVTSEDWVLNALPNIWSRMGEYGGGFEFNLLAMCQSPLRSMCREIAANARVLDLIDRRLGDLPGPTPETDNLAELPVPEKFPEYWVTPEMASESPIPENVRPLLSLLGAIPSEGGPEAPDPSAIIAAPRATLLPALRSALGAEPELLPTAETITLTPPDIRAHLETLAAKTRTEQDDAIERHALEMESLSTDLERVEGRKKDYAPAIHEWMKILAEKGVLEQIAG